MVEFGLFVIGVLLGRFAWDPIKEKAPILWTKLKEKFGH